METRGTWRQEWKGYCLSRSEKLLPENDVNEWKGPLPFLEPRVNATPVFYSNHFSNLLRVQFRCFSKGPLSYSFAMQVHFKGVLEGNDGGARYTTLTLETTTWVQCVVIQDSFLINTLVTIQQGSVFQCLRPQCFFKPQPHAGLVCM